MGSFHRSAPIFQAIKDFPDKDAMGTREVLGEEEELQKDGKVSARRRKGNENSCGRAMQDSRKFLCKTSDPVSTRGSAHSMNHVNNQIEISVRSASRNSS